MVGRNEEEEESAWSDPLSRPKKNQQIRRHSTDGRRPLLSSFFSFSSSKTVACLHRTPVAGCTYTSASASLTVSVGEKGMNIVKKKGQTPAFFGRSGRKRRRKTEKRMLTAKIRRKKPEKQEDLLDEKSGLKSNDRQNRLQEGTERK